MPLEHEQAPERQESVRLRLVTLLSLFGIILLGAVFLRFFQLSVIPPGLNFDEGAHGIDALTILNGHFISFSWEGGGREALFAYMVAVFVQIMGRIPLAIHLPAALASLLAVAATFGVGYTLFEDSGDQTRLFGKVSLQYHHFVALLATAWMAFSLNQTILGRTGWRANYFLLLLLVAVWFLWAGMRRNHLGLLVGAGVATGLLPYTYIPARLFPILILLFVGSSLFLGQISNSDRQRLQRGALLYVGVAGLVAAPILLFFLLNPDAFFYRSKYLWIADSAVNQGSLGGTLLQSVISHIKAFGLEGDSRLIHNFQSLPLLGPIQSLFFWGGLGYSIVHWRRPAHRFLLFWFFLMLVPAVMAFDNNPPNFLRMMGAIPPAYLLGSMGVWQVLAALQRLGKQMAGVSRRNWERGIGILLIVLLLGQGGRVYRLYFQGWAKEERLFSVYHGYVVDLVHDLEAAAPHDNLTYMIPLSNFNQSGRLYNFEFLYQGETSVHLLRTADIDFPEKLQNAVIHDVTTLGDPEIRSVNWFDTDAADPTGAMIFLLSKYATQKESWSQSSYGIDSYTQPMLDRKWRFYEELVPVAVQYDVGVELNGVAIGRHGGDQFFEPTVHLTTDQGPLWLALAWRANQTIVPNLRISLRLYNEAKERVHLEEYELRDLFERPTSEWRPGDETKSYQIFPLPSDLPDGHYQLKLLIYDLQSLAPSVQVGIWEPEIAILDFELGH